MFAVVFETAYSTKVLFEGSKNECKQYIKDYPEMCADFCFIQELECV